MFILTFVCIVSNVYKSTIQTPPFYPLKGKHFLFKIFYLGPGVYETTNKEHFVQHKAGKRYQKPAPATYQPNQRPFDGKSMMMVDYQPHSNADKSEMIKYDNNLFNSADPLDQETTNSTTYKSWEVQRRQVFFPLIYNH